MTATPSSPCVKTCVIDETTRLCRGCGRTLDEIARWSGLGETARRAIMDGLPRRRADLAQGGRS